MKATRKALLNAPTVLLLMVLGAILGHTTQANLAGAPVAPAIVATVDLERIFVNLEARGAADAALTKLADELDAAGQKQRDAIELLRQDLEFFPPASKKYQETSQEIAKLSFKLKAYLDFAVRKLDSAKSKSLRQLYADIKTAIEEEAKDKGYDLVVVDDSIVKLPADASEQETMRQISGRRLLYSTSQIDITEDVVARMNG
jgi:Skp family chaperone for outer membrane proteins